MCFSLILTIILSASTFQESPHLPIDSVKGQTPSNIFFNKSKKFLQKIYLRSNKNLTFYCGCSFNLKKEIDNESSNYSPKNKINKRSRRHEFEHVVPASKIGKNLECWKEPICKKRNGKNYKGRRCCKKVSKEYKKNGSRYAQSFSLYWLSQRRSI